jgi:adenylosuccinate lyase
MGRVWSDENRYQRWLDVELAAAETLAEAGQVPREAAATLRARAMVDATRINDLEAKVKHDVIAFTMAVANRSAIRMRHGGCTTG